MKEYMKVKEVAEYLTVSPEMIHRLVTANKIPFARIGTRIIFSKHEVDAWLKSKQVKVKNG